MCIFLYVYILICVAYVYTQYVAHVSVYYQWYHNVYQCASFSILYIYIYIVHVCVGLYVCLVLPVRIRTNNFALKKQDAYPIIPPCTVIKRGNGKAPIHR